MEVLPDSSTIIALSKARSLDLLKETFGKIIITKVEREITSGDFPEIGDIRRVEIIKKLSRSDFRMTVELYDWALERLK